MTSCWVIDEPPWTTPLVGLVGDQRAQRALQVEGAVLVEAVVLDRDDRLDHGPRDALERDGDPVLVVERRQPVAVRVEDRGPLGQRVGLELLGQVVHGPATFRAPTPATPANGIARPATTTPSTAETAIITTRWESTRWAGSRSWRGMDTAPGYGSGPKEPIQRNPGVLPEGRHASGRPGSVPMSSRRPRHAHSRATKRSPTGVPSTRLPPHVRPPPKGRMVPNGLVNSGYGGRIVHLYCPDPTNS